MLVNRGSGDVPALLDVADGDFHFLLLPFTELVSRSVNPAVSIEKTKSCSPVNMLVREPVNMYAGLQVYMYTCFFLKKFLKLDQFWNFACYCLLLSLFLPCAASLAVGVGHFFVCLSF